MRSCGASGRPRSLSPRPAVDPELLAQRDRLTERFALMQSELGGPVLRDGDPRPRPDGGPDSQGGRAPARRRGARPGRADDRVRRLTSRRRVPGLRRASMPAAPRSAPSARTHSPRDARPAAIDPTELAADRAGGGGIGALHSRDRRDDYARRTPVVRVAGGAAPQRVAVHPCRRARGASAGAGHRNHARARGGYRAAAGHVPGADGVHRPQRAPPPPPAPTRTAARTTGTDTAPTTTGTTPTPTAQSRPARVRDRAHHDELPSHVRARLGRALSQPHAPPPGHAAERLPHARRVGAARLPRDDQRSGAQRRHPSATARPTPSSPSSAKPLGSGQFRAPAASTRTRC